MSHIGLLLSSPTWPVPSRVAESMAARRAPRTWQHCKRRGHSPILLCNHAVLEAAPVWKRSSRSTRSPTRSWRRYLLLQGAVKTGEPLNVCIGVAARAAVATADDAPPQPPTGRCLRQFAVIGAEYISMILRYGAILFSSRHPSWTRLRRWRSGAQLCGQPLRQPLPTSTVLWRSAAGYVSKGWTAWFWSFLRC